MSTIFNKIINKEIPADIVYEINIFKKLLDNETLSVEEFNKAKKNFDN